MSEAVPKRGGSAFSNLRASAELPQEELTASWWKKGLRRQAGATGSAAQAGPVALPHGHRQSGQGPGEQEALIGVHVQRAMRSRQASSSMPSAMTKRPRALASATMARSRPICDGSAASVPSSFTASKGRSIRSRQCGRAGPASSMAVLNPASRQPISAARNCARSGAVRDSHLKQHLVRRYASHRAKLQPAAQGFIMQDGGERQVDRDEQVAFAELAARHRGRSVPRRSRSAHVRVLNACVAGMKSFGCRMPRLLVCTRASASSPMGARLRASRIGWNRIRRPPPCSAVTISREVSAGRLEVGSARALPKAASSFASSGSGRQRTVLEPS